MAAQSIARQERRAQRREDKRLLSAIQTDLAELGLSHAEREKFFTMVAVLVEEMDFSTGDAVRWMADYLFRANHAEECADFTRLDIGSVLFDRTKPWR